MGAAVPASSGGAGGGAGVAAKGGPMQRKDGARQAAECAAAVALNHARIRGGMGQWRSCLLSGRRVSASGFFFTNFWSGVAEDKA
jgi:hypothetical protein